MGPLPWVGYRMVYGAALIFDEPSESALRGVWQALADSGLPSFMLGVDYPPISGIQFGAYAVEGGSRLESVYF